MGDGRESSVADWICNEPLYELKSKRAKASLYSFSFIRLFTSQSYQRNRQHWAYGDVRRLVDVTRAVAVKGIISIIIIIIHPRGFMTNDACM